MRCPVQSAEPVLQAARFSSGDGIGWTGSWAGRWGHRRNRRTRYAEPPPAGGMEEMAVSGRPAPVRRCPSADVFTGQLTGMNSVLNGVFSSDPYRDLTRVWLSYWPRCPTLTVRPLL